MSHLEELLQGLQDTLATVTVSINRAKGALCRARNALVNVNTLPEEILRLIMLNAAQYTIAHKVRLSTICWRWRSICVSFPRLWAEFYACGFSPRSIQRSITLAQGQVLNVTVDMNMLSAATKSVLLRNRASIECMTLVLPHCPTTRAEWLQADFPLLRELYLQGTRRFYDDILPPLNQRQGRLRRAHMVNCRLPYSAQHYACLQELSICSDCPDDERRSGGQGDGLFLDALSGCHDIQQLSLYDVPMTVEECETRPKDHPLYPIRLPSLRSLRLSMALQKASAILTSIATSASSLRDLHVDLRGWDSARSWRRVEVDRESILSLPSPECLPALSRLHSLSMGYSQNISGQFARDGDPRPSHRSDALSITFAHDSDRETNELMEVAFGNFLDSMLRHNALQTLCHLRLQDFRPVDTLRILRATPALRTLTLLACVSPGELLRSLLDMRMDGDSVAPQLGTVVLAECHYSSKELDMLSEVSGTLAIRLEVQSLVAVMEDDLSGFPRIASTV